MFDFYNLQTHNIAFVFVCLLSFHNNMNDFYFFIPYMVSVPSVDSGRPIETDIKTEFVHQPRTHLTLYGL